MLKLVDIKEFKKQIEQGFLNSLTKKKSFIIEQKLRFTG